jgi:YggT family protein
MFILGNFLIALGKALAIAIKVYMVLIILSAVSTWFVVDPFHPLIKFLRGTTEPVFSRVRRFIPPIAYVDISPLFVLFILYFLLQFLPPTLIKIGISLH